MASGCPFHFTKHEETKKEEEDQQQEQKQQFQDILCKVDSKSKRSFIDRYMEYTSNLAYADKFVKIASYGVGMIAGGSRLLSVGDEELWKGLHTVGGEIGKTRMVYRTFELPGSFEAIKKEKGAGAEWADRRIHKLNKVVNWCNIFYIVTEHLAWAHSRAPDFVKVPFGSDKFWAFSGFWWMGCCIFQIWMDLLKMKELKRKEIFLQKALKACPDNEDVQNALFNTLRLKRSIKFSLLRYAFFLPNSYHWSLEHGCFSRGFACLLGFSEALTGIIATFPEA